MTTQNPETLPAPIPAPIPATLFCGFSKAWRAWLLGCACAWLSAGPWPLANAQQTAIEEADWLHLNPSAQRVDAAQLSAMTQHLKGQHPAVRSFLMVRNGQPVYEYYGADIDSQSLHNVYSVTKSVVSLLVGRAIDQGLMTSTDETLANLLLNSRSGQPANSVATAPTAQTAPTAATAASAASAAADASKGPVSPVLAGAITLGHLLNMSAGFDQAGTQRSADYLDFERRFYTPGMLAFALDRPVVATPGQQFHYNNTDAHLASLALSARVGMPVAAYAQAQLFQPLGITHFAWTADAKGTTNGASELRLRSRDMAKIGQLVLQGGQWQGAQMVSSAYVERATRRQIDTPVSPDDTAKPWGYGYLWWTSATRGDPLTAPLTDHFAAGFGGQYIYIVPALKLVVVATTQASSRAMAAKTAGIIRNWAVPAVMR